MAGCAAAMAGSLPGTSRPTASATPRARRTSLTTRCAMCVITFYSPLTIRRANGKGPRTNHPGPFPTNYFYRRLLRYLPVRSNQPPPVQPCVKRKKAPSSGTSRLSHPFNAKKAPFSGRPGDLATQRLRDLATRRPCDEKDPLSGASSFNSQLARTTDPVFAPSAE